MNKLIDIDEKMRIKPHRGYTLREIYQYSPNYIEWLIKNTKRYFVDLAQFENLPTPTPYEYTERRQMIPGRGPFLELAFTGRDQIQDARDYLANGNLIPESRHHFSDYIIDINERKRGGEDYPGIEYVSMEMP